LNYISWTLKTSAQIKGKMTQLIKNRYKIQIHPFEICPVSDLNGED